MGFWKYLKKTFGLDLMKALGIKTTKIESEFKLQPHEPKQRKYGTRIYGLTSCGMCGAPITKRTPRHAVCDNPKCKRTHKTELERARRRRVSSDFSENYSEQGRSLNG